MNLKLVGAILVIASCGGFGFLLAANYRREEKMLRQLLKILEFMECELRYRQSALPQMCKDAASYATGCIGKVFTLLASELEMQVCPDAVCCMDVSLKNVQGLSTAARQILLQLGRSLGRFDLNGQLSELASVKAACNELLEDHLSHKEVRIRNYQTLGLCAGAALAILLI